MLPNRHHKSTPLEATPVNKWASRSRRGNLFLTGSREICTTNQSRTWFTPFKPRTFTGLKTGLALALIFSLFVPITAPLAEAAAVTRGKAISETAADPYWRNVVFSAFNDSKADGVASFTDSSNKNHTITPAGNIQYDTAQAPTGLTSSVQFDGSGDYATVPHSNDFEFGSGNFAIEFWIRYTGAPYNQVLFKGTDGATYKPFVINIQNGGLKLFSSSNGTSWDITEGSSFFYPADNTWGHIVLSRTGNSIEGYYNGTRKFQLTTSASLLSNAGDLGIAAGCAGCYGAVFDGHLASIRITKGTNRGYTGATIPVPSLPLPVGDSDEPIIATGGTITTVGNYRVHTFNSSGTFRVLKGKANAWYLVVGGGGGGGTQHGGGGGAGGFRTNSGYTYPISAGSYTVTIGAGGAGSPSGGNGNRPRGSPGNDSVFSTITATGGGGGGSYSPNGSNDANLDGGTGGSGGGGGIRHPSGSPLGGNGTTGQGNNGGAGFGTDATVCTYVGGGGGGAGAAGNAGNKPANGTTDGKGGDGLTSSITGVSVTYAGGGGGGTVCAVTGVSGGSGGGGKGGGSDQLNGGDGTANTGGGGGSGSAYQYSGGNGGSGVVIIRYPIGKIAAKPTTSFINATGGTITRFGNRKIHTFTSSGTFTVTSGNGKVQYLVVGGGGGGGFAGGGGGGAGGFVTNDGFTYPVSVGSYTVTVGAGGHGSTATVDNSTSGSNSIFDTITAIGGGRGGNGDSGPGGSSGGSGGGGRCISSGGTGGSGTSGQGNSGGAGFSGTDSGNGNCGGGGGGGAGAAGQAAPSLNTGGAGGDGRASSITGRSVMYAGGGGGQNASGGAGGGGGTGTAGVANTGGGGGGYASSGGSGGNGGSGVVVVAYEIGQTPKSPPAQGLVGWWPFDTGFVTDKIYDRSNRGNHGYFYNGATSTANVAGKRGKAFSFDGSNDFVSLPVTGTHLVRGNLGFSSSDPFTLSVWYKGTDTAQNGDWGKGLICWNDTAMYACLILRSGYAEYLHSAGAWQHNIKSTSLVADGAWHHITYVNSSNLGYLYIDGVKQIDGLDSTISTGGTYFQPYHIGASYNNAFTSGLIDDVRIYNRALSAAEVLQLYSSR